MKRLLALLFLLLPAPAYAGITCVLPYNLQNNTTADANQVMANYNALVTCFTNAAAAGVNNDITALNALVTPVTPSQGGTPVYIGGTSTGSANAQVVASATPIGFTAVNGKRVTFIAGFSNTTATTLNVNGTGIKNVFKATQGGSIALTGGEIIAGTVVEVIYDGTQYQLLPTPDTVGGFGPLTSVASGATVDLGATPSHNVLITGVAAITSLGSSAALSEPIYRISFNGAATLTYNAASLILPGTANIVTAANDSATAMYLGGGNWQIINYAKATGTAVVNPTPLCGANGLVITNNAGTPNTSTDITADSAVLVNPTGNVPLYTTSASVTINNTVNGANGLDAGSLANTTFYNFYLISDGTTIAGLASTSATAPTMPSSYTYRCRLGAAKTNGSAVFYGFRQSGNTTQYTVGGANLAALPTVITGTTGTNCTTTTPGWSAQTIRAASGVAPVWIPSTATDVQVTLYGASTDNVEVAPNASYAGVGSASDNQAPLSSNGGASSQNVSLMGWLKMEANTIQVCATEASRVVVGVLGWKDKVNAN